MESMWLQEKGPAIRKLFGHSGYLAVEIAEESERVVHYDSIDALKRDHPCYREHLPDFGVEQDVEIYNLANPLTWKEISDDSQRKTSELLRALDEHEKASRNSTAEIMYQRPIGLLTLSEPHIDSETIAFLQKTYGRGSLLDNLQNFNS